MEEVHKELLLVGRHVGCLKRGQNNPVVQNNINSDWGGSAGRASTKMPAVHQGYHRVERGKMAGFPFHPLSNPAFPLI